MVSDRHDLELGTAEFGQSRCRRLAQPVRLAVQKTSLVAPGPKTVPEPVVGEGPPVFRDEKSRGAGQRRIDDLPERLDHVVGAARLVSFVVTPLSNVFGVERCGRQIAADLANSIENFPPDILLETV